MIYTIHHQLRKDIPSLLEVALAKLHIPELQRDARKEPHAEAHELSGKQNSIMLSTLMTSVNSSIASIERMVAEGKATDAMSQTAMAKATDELAKQLSGQHAQTVTRQKQTDAALSGISSTVSKVLGNVLAETKRRKLAEHNLERRREMRAAVLQDVGTIIRVKY